MGSGPACHLKLGPSPRQFPYVARRCTCKKMYLARADPVLLKAWNCGTSPRRLYSARRLEVKVYTRPENRRNLVTRKQGGRHEAEYLRRRDSRSVVLVGGFY